MNCCFCWPCRPQSPLSGYDDIDEIERMPSDDKCGKLTDEEKRDYRLVTLMDNWERATTKKCKLRPDDSYYFPLLFKKLRETRDFKEFFRSAKYLKIYYNLLF